MSANSVDTAFSLFDMKDKIRPYTYWLHVITITCVASIMLIMWQTAVVWGSLHTVQSHAFLLTNLHGILLVPFMYITKNRVHKLELAGAMMASIAVLFIIVDTSSTRAHYFGHISKKRHNASQSGTIFVDIALLFSNVPAAIYFAINKNLMQKRLVPHLFALNILTCVGFCALVVILGPG